jgi:hypothetical protein
MNQEDAELIDTHHRRVRWLKRFMRFLPRRSSIHRYPGLKWVAGFARNRMYLWSFRYRAVAPALYAGTILSFLPLFGIQVPLAFLLSLALKANLPIFVGLQFITNWFTVAPIYFVCFQVGRMCLMLFEIHVDPLTVEQLREFLARFGNGELADNGRFLARVFFVTSLGSLIIGSFFGLLFDRIYKFMAWRASITCERVRQIRERRRKLAEAQAAAGTTPVPAPSARPRFFPRGSRSDKPRS